VYPAAVGCCQLYFHTLRIKKYIKVTKMVDEKCFCQQRSHGGSSLLCDLKFQSVSGQYKNFTRMSPTEFKYRLTLIGGHITKNDATLRKAIPVQEIFAITLRFLATGDSYATLQYLFRVSKQAISNIIPEVCMALVEQLEEYIHLPRTEEEWLLVSNQFEEVWNCPHTLSAIDGKHVVIQCPMKWQRILFLQRTV
jgi:hypothetical protein